MLKTGTILATFILSIFLLLPSFLPKDSWLERHLPGKKLNLGLDLRGGIHVVLGVDVSKALDVEMDRFSRDLKERLTEKNISVSKVERSRGTRELMVHFLDAQGRQAFENFLKEYFYQVLAITQWENSLTAVVGLEPEHEKYIQTMSLEQAREVIRNRVDEFGVAEPIIQIQGADRILVQLPGVQDPERAIQLIGRTALLEFKLVSRELNASQLNVLIEKAKDFKKNFTRADLQKLNNTLKKELPAGTEISFEKEMDRVSREVALRPYLLKATTVLTGQALEDARVSSDSTTQRPQVSLRFNPSGAETFEKVTEANVGELLAILLDGVVVSAPVIREKIPAVSAGATISLGIGGRNQMIQEARDLAVILRSGALPAPVEILENRTVGASLGEDSIQRGQLACIIGSIFVVLFTILYYRWSGALAVAMLALNILILMAVMALFQATLTLPGIAGIALTIGMAVDANVIILERVREELRIRDKIRVALEAGYEGAHKAIFDANLTTVLAGAVLYNFGTGPIRGFAVTLLIGLIANYIAAVWFSRWVYEWYFDRHEVNRFSI